MLMPKKNRVAIYEYLFKEGVMVAEKDFHAPKHPALETVPNLHVIKALQSLKSRGYVKEQFAWRHFYWYLTNEGIQYLRDFLHLPPEIVPPTLKRQVKTESARPRTQKADENRPQRDGGRDNYRRDFDREGGGGGGGAPERQFRGGFGRGAGGPGFGGRQ
ncbi:40S ribosomal protein S10-like [Oppia nitens]|uniref:40S ribosomal protein S10-like n=1 Tax=Oppia nitens TaxID=1686743 RepID=UPI0023DBB6EC|nr:40S ribosomal protein S10-like [Oppia nitens]XP_054153805.1 40S ribosomal protein S10-like [Oppia nitens]